MRPAFLVCLLLLPGTFVRGDEIDGLNSRAIDISKSAFLPRGQYNAAFASLGSDGRANGITVQTRFTDAQITGWIACTTTVPLPPSARQISQPALSTSGWLFVSANTSPSPEASDGWRLYATQQAAARDQCQGWDNGWIDLGHFPDRPVGSAPDAVFVYDSYTYVFVTDRGGFIDYRMFDNSVTTMPSGRPARNPNRTWSAWRSLAAINPTVNRQYVAASKPAVAVYTEGASRLHVFWHDSSHRRINHVSTLVTLFGELREEPPDSREFRDNIGRIAARTACSAGPEITAPNPLFVVCGSSRGTGPSPTTYSIAHYRRPRSSWANETAVNWISRSAYGGFSAPSLGRTNLAASIPLMFVTFGVRFCPESTRVRPPLPPRVPASCLQPEDDQWIIQNRYSTLASVGWEERMYEDPPRGVRLYQP